MTFLRCRPNRCARTRLFPHDPTKSFGRMDLFASRVNNVSRQSNGYCNIIRFKLATVAVTVRGNEIRDESQVSVVRIAWEMTSAPVTLGCPTDAR